MSADASPGKAPCDHGALRTVTTRRAVTVDVRPFSSQCMLSGVGAGIGEPRINPSLRHVQSELISAGRCAAAILQWDEPPGGQCAVAPDGWL